eukprot:TRINITY_DN3809_c0_g1_i7.p1 TRINITY_DN3809_c0_g1~~TRINITY_DN3809_c0_g1_i7.p1  ORF type:complete len:283 (-),score=38.58 TRINITY_DN3809_c0_g1_i7:248-1096(-)
MLVGANAPLIVEKGLKASHSEHVYDFFKPLHDKEYPVVNGKLSQECYLKSLDKCYGLYKKRYTKQHPTHDSFDLQRTDYVLFHSPYNKLVQQSLARLLFNDFLDNPTHPIFANVATKHQNKKREETYNDRDLQQDFWKLGKETYTAKVAPTTTLALELGNSYCASLYSCVVSLLMNKTLKVGARLLLFSYGSGSVSTMFSLRVVRDVSQVVKSGPILQALQNRFFSDPQSFSQALLRNETRFLAKGFTPTQPLDELSPGTHYLTRVDENYQRFYDRLPKSKL